MEITRDVSAPRYAPSWRRFSARVSGAVVRSLDWRSPRVYRSSSQNLFACHRALLRTVVSSWPAQPVADRLRKETGVEPNAAEKARGQPGLKLQADKVKSRLSLHDSPMMPRQPILNRDRHVYPPVVMAEACAPHDGVGPDTRPVLEHWQPVLDCHDAFVWLP